VELTGSAGSQGAVQSVPVGVKLEVTPKFFTAHEVELKVTAARAFIEGRSSDAGFNNFTQTTKNLVTANVTMKFGDTLVLSGLSEKETENLRDGVPLLQDLPGIQYLFSSENTLNYTKSIVVLLTPRKPRYTYEDGTEKIDLANPADSNVDQTHLHELKKGTLWHKPAANLDAVFWHLKNGKFFKEFRSGDVRLEKWNYPHRLQRMTERAVQFLYY
jgi:type II secretory pathway component GspD/PulD (secretin)